MKEVSLSTTKDEYHGDIYVETTEVWICHLLKEFGFPIQASILMSCDNQGVIQVTQNLVPRSNMKHVKLHVHYLRQMVQERVVSLIYCRTYYQVDDIFMNHFP